MPDVCCKEVEAEREGMGGGWEDCCRFMGCCCVCCTVGGCCMDSRCCMVDGVSTDGASCRPLKPSRSTKAAVPLPLAPPPPAVPEPTLVPDAPPAVPRPLPLLLLLLALVIVTVGTPGPSALPRPSSRGMLVDSPKSPNFTWTPARQTKCADGITASHATPQSAQTRLTFVLRTCGASGTYMRCMAFASHSCVLLLQCAAD